VIPLKIASVVALLKLRRKRRIAGGTAEGMPFVPIAGMMGNFLFVIAAGIAGLGGNKQ